MGMLIQAHLGEQSGGSLTGTFGSFGMFFFLPERTLGSNKLLVGFIALSARFRKSSVGLRGPSVDLSGPYAGRLR